MKKAGTNMSPDWSKRSSMQYAYKKVMGIHPEEIKEIEKEREFFRVVYMDKNPMPTGISFLESKEKADYFLEMNKHMTPKFPEVPDDLKFQFFIAIEEHKDWHTK